jgi:hypothetical protein
MITSIRFSKFSTAPKHTAPVGNPIGYGMARVKSAVPVHNKRVNVNGK